MFALYKREIKKKYEEAKFGQYGPFLLSPSQARLRNLCIEICKNGRQPDLQIFRWFMGYDFDASAMRKIKSANDKFRAISKFLKGLSDLNDVEAADMLALMVDFEPRPYAKYFQNKTQQTDRDIDVTIDKPQAIYEEVISSPLVIGSDSVQGISKGNRRDRRLIAMGISIVLLFIIAIFATQRYFGPLADCMVWTEDHYEAVECDSVNGGVPMKKSQFALRRVPVWDTTTFFKKGRPLYWYSKKGGDYEFYNQSGYHPVDESIVIRKVSSNVAERVRKGEIKIKY